MADASDSKSDVGDYVWVQVPSPALKGEVENPSIWLFLGGFALEYEIEYS